MKIKLQIKYKGSKTIPLKLTSEWIDDKDLELLILDFDKSGRILDILIMDEMGREWNWKEFKKLKKKLEDEPTNPIVYFDGGYDRSREKAGIGVVIYYDKGENTFRYRLNALLDSIENSSEAEYAALYFALQFLEEKQFKNQIVKVCGDAQGVIKQLLGEWPCFDKVLNAWLDKIEEKIRLLNLQVHYEIISRKDNTEADSLARQALANQEILSHIQIK